ncbi:hypothetical protein SFRURICE_003865, partial [Spodoptera frugiperda]
EIVQIWLFLNRLLNKNILFALFFCIVSVETPIYCVGKYKVDTLVGKHIFWARYQKIINPPAEFLDHILITYESD